MPIVSIPPKYLDIWRCINAINSTICGEIGWKIKGLDSNPSYNRNKGKDIPKESRKIDMFTLFEWLVVPGLIQISAVSLFYFTIQFTAQYFPKNEKQKLAKSLRIGLAFISLSISLYSLAEILDTNNKFQLAGFLFLLVCLIVPWGMVVAILTYFRFGIVQKYYKKKM